MTLENLPIFGFKQISNDGQLLLEVNDNLAFGYNEKLLNVIIHNDNDDLNIDLSRFDCSYELPHIKTIDQFKNIYLLMTGEELKETV